MMGIEDYIGCSVVNIGISAIMLWKLENGGNRGWVSYYFVLDFCGSQGNQAGINIE